MYKAQEVVIVSFLMSVPVCVSATNTSLLLCHHEWNCLCSARDIDCSGLNLTSLNGSDWGNLDPETHLVFSRNRLETLPKTGIFSTSMGTTVVSLDLSQNHLSEIEDRAFVQLFNLRHLQLHHNRLEYLTGYTFAGLSKLQRLDLSYNRLKNISDLALAPCISLTELNLRYTSLVHVDAALLAPLTNLEILGLNNNALSYLDEDLFINNTMLTNLDLSSNFLTEVPSKALEPLANLVQLDLSDNSLTEIPPRAFFGLSSLDTLTLNTMDHLQKINAHAFDGLDSLREFSCSFNHQLKTIDAAAFRPTDGDVVHYVGRVEQLRLRQNELSSLDQLLLPWMYVENIDVQENPWHCDCHLQWLKMIIAEKDLSSHMSRCSSPPSLHYRRLVEVSVHEFVCPADHNDAMISVIFFLVAFLVVLSVVAFLSCWKIRTCAKCRETYQQRYMKLSTVGRDAERVEMECPLEGRARHNLEV